MSVLLQLARNKPTYRQIHGPKEEKRAVKMWFIDDVMVGNTHKPQPVTNKGDFGHDGAAGCSYITL